jgi:predicted MPP superfamily phosphohydrolase
MANTGPVPRILLFLAVVLGIVGGVHFYFWMRLVRDTQLPFPYRPWASGALIVLAACLPLPFLVMRRLSPEWGRLVAWPAFIWMGLMFLLFTLLVATDLVRLAAVLGSRAGLGAALDPARRTLLARGLGGLAALGAGVIGVVAIRQALRALTVTEVDVRLPRLPAASDGTTIVQLSDMHVGATIGRAFVEEVVRRTNALRPDVVAITGDLVDGTVANLWEAVSPLAGLRARHGVFFVTGNHEYYSGVEQWMAALPRLNIKVLDNERVAIGPDGGGFDLAGVHDHAGQRMPDGPRADMARALGGRDPARACVLLAHQPKAIEEAARLGVGLQLSGHTHGGQIWPFSYLVRLAQPYLAGLHRHGDTFIYVNAGTGYWGPPMRLGTRAEITRITLRAAADAS